MTERLLSGFLPMDIIMKGKQNQLHCIGLMDRRSHTEATYCSADVVSHVTTLMKYSARNNSDTQGPAGFSYSRGEDGTRVAASSFSPYMTTCTQKGPFIFNEVH